MERLSLYEGAYPKTHGPGEFGNGKELDAQEGDGIWKRNGTWYGKSGEV